MNQEDELLTVFAGEVGEQLEHMAEALHDSPESWDVGQLFRWAHNIKGAARMVEADQLRTLAHLLEEVFALLRDGTKPDVDAVKLIRQGLSLLEKAFAAFQLQEPGPEPGEYARQIEQCLERLEQAASDDGDEADDEEEKVLELAPAVSPSPTRSQAAPARETTPTPERSTGETLRVAVDKLDSLLGLATEFAASTYRNHALEDMAVDLQGALEELAREFPEIKRAVGFPPLQKAAGRLRTSVRAGGLRDNQLSAQLQDGIRAMRMVRLDSLRAQCERVVRDACESTGKSVALQIVGGDTELDRAVLYGLRDPLIHLLRNAVAHGIEPGKERIAKGKPSNGTIRMEARSSGASVEVLVIDDGAGIRYDRIRSKATIAGIDLAGYEPEDPRLLDLIFDAGFSTASDVDELAGRGVGLDVVKQNVVALGGRISVHTEEGRGATFHLQVPLTRLTTRGVLVRLGTSLYAVPIVNLDRTLLATDRSVRQADGKRVISVDDQLVRVVALEQVLDVSADTEVDRPAVVVEHGSQRKAFLVDEVLGEREFMLQRLSWNLRGMPGVSGATVLDGGNVVLVLDISSLLGGEMSVKASSAGVKTVTQRQRRILVADDSVTSRTLVKNILGSAGYHVELAVDGEDGWGKLSAGTYDLVVSDVEMPRLTGLEFARRIRGHESARSLPLILVTSLGNDEHKRQGVEAGADAYIVKGVFDQDQLLEAVARLLP